MPKGKSRQTRPPKKQTVGPTDTFAHITVTVGPKYFSSMSSRQSLTAVALLQTPPVSDDNCPPALVRASLE